MNENILIATVSVIGGGVFTYLTTTAVARIRAGRIQNGNGSGRRQLDPCIRSIESRLVSIENALNLLREDNKRHLQWHMDNR